MDEATLSKQDPSTGAVQETERNGQTAPDFVERVYNALAEGAHLQARELALEGHRLYPDNAQLRKMAELLAPPTVSNARTPADPTVTANQQWLRANANRYRGQWIALHNGELLSVAPTLRELKRQSDLPAGSFVTRVA